MQSAHTMAQLPRDEGIEVAFTGRSNVGKSSAINAITRQHKLARTSKTPGRTQLLNFFAVDNQHRLVDLPGYGYAKVSAQARRHWDKLLDEYFQTRQSLSGLILIMDIRHPLKSSDIQMLHWCEVTGLPAHILLNKADKLSRGAAMNRLQEVMKHLTHENISIQLFSALHHTGLARARKVLDQWFNL